MRIQPGHAAHADLERDVDAYLHDRGYLNFAAPYHETFPPEMQSILQRRNSWTALHLRGRADRIAVHLSLPSEFEWEAKTHDNERYSDLCFELLPFLHHRAKASLAVKCMYIFRIPHAGIEGGFWVKDRPPVRQVFITDRLPQTGRGTFRTRVTDAFPEAQVVDYRKRTSGTDDPFLIVDASEARRCADWRVLIDDEMTRAGRT